MKYRLTRVLVVIGFLVLLTAACTVAPASPFPTSQMIQSALAKCISGSALAFPQPENRLLSGAAVVISADGYVLTNEHVATKVNPGKPMEVVLGNGETYPVRLIGKDSFIDIALVKIDADHPLPYVEMGDSDALRVGDWVMAIGNPMTVGSADGQPSVAMGIISGKHRFTEARGGPGMPAETFHRYTDGLQLDLPVQPGNSGGAAVDLNGSLIGINGAGDPMGGFGLATPINQIKRYLPRLKAGESIRHADLEVEGRALTMEETTKLGRGGYKITKLIAPDGGSKDLRPGDVILAVNGAPVKTGLDLIHVIDRCEVGQTVTLEALRKGKKITMNVVLGELKVDMERINKERQVGDLSREAIGLMEAKKYAEALKKFSEALAVIPDDPGVYYNMACCYSLMDKPDEAFQSLRKSVDLGLEEIEQVLRDPDLAQMRSDPRFEAFYKEMKELKAKKDNE